MRRPNFVSLCLATLWTISLILHHPHLGRSHLSFSPHLGSHIGNETRFREDLFPGPLGGLSPHFIGTALIMDVRSPVNTPPWMIFTFLGPLWIPFLRMNFNYLATHFSITRTRLPNVLIPSCGGSSSGFAVNFRMGRKSSTYALHSVV